MRAGEFAGVWALRKCLDHVGSRALFVITRWAWRLLSSLSDSLYPVDKWFSEQGVQNSINITRKLAVRVNSWDHPTSTNQNSGRGAQESVFQYLPHDSDAHSGQRATKLDQSFSIRVILHPFSPWPWKHLTCWETVLTVTIWEKEEWHCHYFSVGLAFFGLGRTEPY